MIARNRVPDWNVRVPQDSLVEQDPRLWRRCLPENCFQGLVVDRRQERDAIFHCLGAELAASAVDFVISRSIEVESFRVHDDPVARVFHPAVRLHIMNRHLMNFSVIQVHDQFPVIGRERNFSALVPSRQRSWSGRCNRKWSHLPGRWSSRMFYG